MERFDVLIVGGGPAGSSCAWALRESGLRVGVLDRARFPRDKVCAGWITPPVLALLGIDPADYAKERILQPIRGFRVSRQGDRAATADFGQVVSYAIRRCELDHHLLQRSGAELRLGEPLERIERVDGRWIVNGAFEAPTLVGAGGHFCPVARVLGAQPGSGERAVVAREIEFEMDADQERLCPVHPELPEIFFTPDLRGYGWLVRKGGWLNVGIGRQDPEAFPRHVAQFLAWLRESGKLAFELPRALRGHAYLLYADASRPLAAEGVLLVGDAAGLAHARSGEGIRPAVESGILAARTIRVNRGRVDASAAAAYTRAIEARFGPRGRPARGPSDWIPARWRGPLAGRLLAWGPFAKRVVVQRWFLQRPLEPLDPEALAN